MGGHLEVQGSAMTRVAVMRYSLMAVAVGAIGSNARGASGCTQDSVHTAVRLGGLRTPRLRCGCVASVDSGERLWERPAAAISSYCSPGTERYSAHRKRDEQDEQLAICRCLLGAPALLVREHPPKADVLCG